MTDKDLADWYAAWENVLRETQYYLMSPTSLPLTKEFVLAERNAFVTFMEFGRKLADELVELRKAKDRSE